MSQGRLTSSSLRDKYLELVSTPEAVRLVTDPFSFAAELATGVFKLGKGGMMVSGGHVVQGLLKGKLLRQIAFELREMQEQGRIPEDYAERSYGMESVAELIDFIDSGTPDPERVKAMKAMFFALNDVGRKDGERVLAYSLMKMTRELTGSQAALLGIYYDAYKFKSNPSDFIDWAMQRIGHSVSSLVRMDSNALAKMQLVNLNASSWQSRLTDLGLTLCTWVEEYGHDELGQDSK